MFAFQTTTPYFCCNILQDCSCFDATFGQLFTLQPPIIFCLSPTLYAHSLLKTSFFRMFMGNYLEKNGERKKFRVSRFQNMEEKTYFLHCFALSANHF